MKSCLFIVFICFISFVFSQEKAPKRFYQTDNNEYAFTFDNYGCTLYKLEHSGNYLYYIGQEFLPVTHELDNQSDSMGILFSNGQYAVSYDYKYFRVLKLKHGKAKDRRTYTAKKLNDPSQVYEAINYKTWEDLYQQMLAEIMHDYPLFNDSYFNEELTVWGNLTCKQVNPKDFNTPAANRIEVLRDSLKRANWMMLSLNNEVERNIDHLTLDELKRNFSSRILYDGYEDYTDKMLGLLAEKRPDLFFDLAESLPTVGEREYIFDGAVYLKKANKSLKQYKTNAPVKKEYLRYMRKQRLIDGLLVTAISVLQSGVIGGAITGIVYWIKK